MTDFVATWDGSPELQTFFQNPAVAALQKVAILDKLNASLGLQKELRNLIAVLINNDRIGHVREVAAAYRALLQERMGIRQAEIVTARELSGEERKTLIEGVGKLAGARRSKPASSWTVDSRRRRGAHRLHGVRRLGARPAGAAEGSIGGGMKKQGFTDQGSETTVLGESKVQKSLEHWNREWVRKG